MYHSTALIRFRLCQYRHRLCRRLAAVYNNGKLHFFCQFYLPVKPFFLRRRIRLRPIVIKTKFTNRHYFFMIGMFPYPIHICFCQTPCFTRMHAQRAIHKVVPLCQSKSSTTGNYVGADIDNTLYSACTHIAKQRFSVFIKSFIIIMTVRVKYHNFLTSLHFLTNFRTRRHWFLRRHQRQISLGVLRT